MDSLDPRRLDGWKAIAAYLHRSERTVLRWRRQQGLPVHQAKAEGTDIVWAVPTELDAWLTALEGRGAPADAIPVRPKRGVLAAGAALAAIAIIAVSIWSARSFRDRLSRRLWPTAAVAGAAPPTHGFMDVLNAPGPWPTQNHDARRSNQSEYAGPVEPSAPELVFDAGTPIASAGGYREPLTVAADGSMFLGVCGALLKVDRAGRELWRQSLIERGFPLNVAGVSMDGLDGIVVAVRPCSEAPDARKVKLLAFGIDGTPRWTQTRAAAYLGPLIGPDLTVFQMDEFNDIHAYQYGMMTWTVDLPGYAQGSIAMDSKGALYVGTDANIYGQPSLWSLDAATGATRWSRGRDAFGTPVVSTADDVYVPDANGGLHAVTRDGAERWSLPGEGSAISFEPLAIGRSGTVYMQRRRDLVAITPTGSIRWTFPFEETSASSGPVLDKDENAYVAAGNTVYRVTPSRERSWRVALPLPGRMLIAGEQRLLVVSARQRIYAITGRDRSSVATP